VRLPEGEHERKLRDAGHVRGGQGDSKGANSSAKSGRNSAKSGSKQAAHTNAKHEKTEAAKHEKTEAAKHEKTEAAKHKKTEAAKKTSPGPAVMKSGTLTEADNEMEFNSGRGSSSPSCSIPIGRPG